MNYWESATQQSVKILIIILYYGDYGYFCEVLQLQAAAIKQRRIKERQMDSLDLKKYVES